MIVVLSPHLDDAIMSLGGTMHLLARLGMFTRVVTLFAGDPAFAGPPSPWDSKRGYATAAEVFHARRDEDRAAFGVLGGESVCLPFTDAGYGNARDPNDVWAALEPHLSGAQAVFVPGSPLSHPDHEYTTMIGLERLGAGTPLVFYAEQPYSSRPRYLSSYLRGGTPAPVRTAAGGDLDWRTVHLDGATRATKCEAVRCYRGELKALGARVHLDAFITRILRRETVAARPDQALPEFLDFAR